MEQMSVEGTMENVLFEHIGKYMPLTAAEQQAILELDLFKPFKKGTILLREGQRSDKGYFVLKGCLRSYYIIDGEERTTAFYTEAESLAPACVLSKEPSAHYVSCSEDSLILVGDTAMERAMFERFPRFETLCRIISEELLTRNQETFDRYRTSTPEERYRDLARARPDLVQRVPQYQLASYLGITPQSLSRLRKRLVKKA
jgi:CRP-like cAMP-binding protein